MDRNKIIKMTVILAAIVVIAGSLTRLVKRDSMSLAEYEQLHASTGTASPAETDTSPALAESSAQLPAESSVPTPDSTPSDSAASDSASPDPASSGLPDADSTTHSTQASDTPEDTEEAPQLIGASLNGSSQLEERTKLADGFYYEPLSDNLCRYITGISFPATESGENGSEPEITFEELRYVHILHYDFDGNSTEGELICNEYIAQDFLEIFYELYRNEYMVEKIRLIDEYDGDDTASMEDNNTSCFNYRVVSGSSHLSKHAYGLAIDINPFYNPYVEYSGNGEKRVSPADALPYADRSLSFPYKIDENDLCYRLFTQHGFIWGGNWNSMKDYQHFQKTK